MKGVRQVNKPLFRSFMVKFGDTPETLSDAMGISLSRLNAKINSNGAEFTQKEIAFVKNRYSLSAAEVDAIFFAENLT